MMEKFSNRALKTVFLLSSLAAFIYMATAPAYGAPDGEVEKLTPARTSVCWYDADMIDELVLNARGSITFLHVDAKLGRALAARRDREFRTGAFSNTPDALYAYAGKYLAKRRHSLFVGTIHANKLWTLDTGKISVAGYAPRKEDIITGVTDNPFREIRAGVSELPSGYDGFIGFFVPSEYLVPGSTIKIGYDSYLYDWLVPGKNQ
jgi:hypothetical protein